MILSRATPKDASEIWIIIQQAIEQRRADGSNQWQNGYPNLQSIEEDIEKKVGFVLIENHQILAYAAVIFDGEPAYDSIVGKWLSNQNYVVVHRVATSNLFKKQGVGTKLFLEIEHLALQNQIYSIKVDTNFDNIPMLKILDKLYYTHCGEVMLKGAPRMAFEKVLK